MPSPLPPTITAIDLLEKIDGFYRSAWDKLIYTVGFGTTLVASFFGVIVPWIMQRQRKDELNRQEQSILKKIEDVSIGIQEKIQKQEEVSNTRLKQLEDGARKQFANARGFSFHIQGNMNMGLKLYVQAVEDYITAVRSYLEAGDQANLLRCVSQLLISLQSATGAQIEKDVQDYFGKLMKEMEGSNDGGRYTDTIKQLNSAFNEALKRVQVQGAFSIGGS